MEIKNILYIVPTPIGNLKDITLRALEVLEGVDLIACEDTRTSGKLLSHYNIKTPTISYHKHNEAKRSAELISRIEQGTSIAVISDAGTPGISDPSSYVIREAILHNIEVDVLPGATATIPALVISGLNTNSFSFIGFMPERTKDKTDLLEYYKKSKETLVIYMSPHSLEKGLKEIYNTLGNRNIAIVREISKLHQTVYRNKIEYFIDNFSEITQKGEFVLVIEGAKPEIISDEFILEEAQKRVAKGESISWVSKSLSKEINVKKNYIYNLLLENRVGSEVE